METLFIAFEGPDGAGKTTQARMLATWLRERGHKVALTREPGGLPFTERIRDLLLSDCTPPKSPTVEALLFFAACAYHYEHLIKPCLEAAMIVICDRYMVSSLIYQSVLGGVSQTAMLNLFQLTTGSHWPDWTVYCDVDPVVGLRRKAGQLHANHIEKRGTDYHDRVRMAFRNSAIFDPKPSLWVDSSESISDIHAAICAACNDILRKKGF